MKFKCIILFLCIFLFSGCYETKKQSYTSRKGLMLMKKSEYDKNQKLYKESKTLKQIKRKSQRQLNNKR